MKLKKHALKVTLCCIAFICFGQAYGQDYISMVGVRVSPETAALSIKISIDEKNHLEGTVGVFTPQPEFTIGAGAAYHRHHPLNEKKNFQVYYGPSLKAVIGDQNSIGVGADAGLMYLFKKIEIGAEVNPTYFLNENLGFQPLFGLHLRWINR